MIVPERYISLVQVSCILMYVYVAQPALVGAWSMALVLLQHIEYYINGAISSYNNTKCEYLVSINMLS